MQNVSSDYLQKVVEDINKELAQQIQSGGGWRQIIGALHVKLDEWGFRWGESVVVDVLDAPPRWRVAWEFTTTYNDELFKSQLVVEGINDGNDLVLQKAYITDFAPV